MKIMSCVRARAPAPAAKDELWLGLGWRQTAGWAGVTELWEARQGQRERAKPDREEGRRGGGERGEGKDRSGEEEEGGRKERRREKGGRETKEEGEQGRWESQCCFHLALLLPHLTSLPENPTHPSSNI